MWQNIPIKVCGQVEVSCLLNTYFMKTYVLLHFEHKNDVTVTVKLMCRRQYHKLDYVKLDNDSDVILC